MQSLSFHRKHFASVCKFNMLNYQRYPNITFIMTSAQLEKPRTVSACFVHLHITHSLQITYVKSNFSKLIKTFEAEACILTVDVEAVTFPPYVAINGWFKEITLLNNTFSWWLVYLFMLMFCCGGCRGTVTYWSTGHSNLSTVDQVYFHVCYSA